MLPALLALALAADAPAFTLVEDRAGILLESRPVPGSPYVELRLTTTSSHTPTSLCDAAFGTGRFDPQEPDLKSRVILQESADERVTYDQISPPLVANRDYTVRARRERSSDGACAVRITTATELLDWGGTVVMLGVPKMGSEASFVVNTMYNDKTIMGCRYGSARPQYDIPLMVKLYQAGRLKLDELVSQTYPLEDFQLALDELHEGKLARGVLNVTG